MSTVDVTDLVKLAAELQATGKQLPAAARAVVSRGALNIKNDWRRNARESAGRHARLYPASVTYDVRTAGGVIEGEVGPDKARPQGALGNLLEFGGATSPPHLDGQRALQAEEPRFIAEMAKLGFV